LAAALFFTGCAGYRLGSTLPPGVASIHVPTFVNRSGEPQLDTEATRATLQELQRDGNLKLLPPDRADAVLKVTLKSFKQEPLRYDPQDSKTAREYRILITADLVLEKRGTRQAVLAQTVQGETTFDFRGDLTSAKLSALPAACRDLAHHIVSAVVEYW
jgi:hypothetical protein